MQTLYRIIFLFYKGNLWIFKINFEHKAVPLSVHFRKMYLKWTLSNMNIDAARINTIHVNKTCYLWKYVICIVKIRVCFLFNDAIFTQWQVYRWKCPCNCICSLMSAIMNWCKSNHTIIWSVSTFDLINCFCEIILEI